MKEKLKIQEMYLLEGAQERKVLGRRERYYESKLKGEPGFIFLTIIDFSRNKSVFF